VLKAEGASDRNRDLPGPEPTRVSRQLKGEIAAVDPYDREVCVRIASDDIRRELASVCEQDADRPAVMYDMTVGEDEAIRGEDQPGSTAVGLLLASASLVRHAADDQLDDARADALDGADNGLRIRVE